MSIKAQTFARIITNPMNLHKFRIDVPDIDYTVIIESSTFPAQGAYREIDLWIQGEKVAYPGLPENGGQWGFKIPEADSGIIKKEFDKKFAAFYNQKTGLFTPHKWDDIVVTCLDLSDKDVFSVVLHGAWILKRGDLSLDASRAEAAAKWDYTFVYNWLEDNEVPDLEGSVAPM